MVETCRLEMDSNHHDHILRWEPFGSDHWSLIGRTNWKVQQCTVEANLDNRHILRWALVDLTHRPLLGNTGCEIQKGKLQASHHILRWNSFGLDQQSLFGSMRFELGYVFFVLLLHRRAGRQRAVCRDRLLSWEAFVLISAVVFGEPARIYLSSFVSGMARMCYGLS